MIKSSKLKRNPFGHFKVISKNCIKIIYHLLWFKFIFNILEYFFFFLSVHVCKFLNLTCRLSLMNVIELKIFVLLVQVNQLKQDRPYWNYRTNYPKPELSMLVPQVCRFIGIALIFPQIVKYIFKYLLFETISSCYCTKLL